MRPQSGSTKGCEVAARGSSTFDSCNSFQCWTVSQSRPATVAKLTYLATTPLETFGVVAICSWERLACHFRRMTSLIMDREIRCLGIPLLRRQSRRGYEGPGVEFSTHHRRR